jgi:hypothetical protein
MRQVVRRGRIFNIGKVNTTIEWLDTHMEGRWCEVLPHEKMDSKMRALCLWQEFECGYWVDEEGKFYMLQYKGG